MLPAEEFHVMRQNYYNRRKNVLGYQHGQLKLFRKPDAEL
jgi:hypothetical protein